MLCGVTVSPTQRRVDYDDVVSRLARFFDSPVIQAEPLPGGSFGTVWSVDLSDGRSVVLKMAPAPDARLLTYEAGMLECEADYLRLAAGADVPTPTLLAQTDTCLIMTQIPGVSMPSVGSDVDTRPARFESGAAISRLHDISGPFFGYTGPRPRSDIWPDAYAAMIDALLADAVAWNIDMPIAPERFRDAVRRNRDVLAQVTTPVLCHFDLWDGNVIVTVADGVAHLSGLVDGERYLYGDPMVDFASPALFREVLEPDDPFLAGYQSVRPFEIDESTLARAWLCQLYLYMVMLVEFPSRGRDADGCDAEAWRHQVSLLNGLLARLGA
jgi:fructosamine-3-kinase